MSHRQIQVEVDEQKAEDVKHNLMVAQGSPISSVIFLIAIIDINLWVKDEDKIGFTDDLIGYSKDSLLFNSCCKISIIIPQGNQTKETETIILGSSTFSGNDPWHSKSGNKNLL